MITTKLAIVLVGTIPLAVYAGGAVQATRAEVEPTPAVSETTATPPFQTTTKSSQDADLTWDASTTHGIATLLLSGDNIRIEKSFDVGAEPSLDTGTTKLAPGVYDYRLEFEPNGLREDKDTLDAIQAFEVTYRAEREQRALAGQREAVRELDATWARKVAQASELSHRIQNGYVDKFIVEQGQIIVDELGNSRKVDSATTDDEEEVQ